MRITAQLCLTLTGSLLFAACASTPPKPAPDPRCAGAHSSATPHGAAADQGAAASGDASPADAPQASLLDLVPAGARAVVLLRRNAVSLPLRLMTASPQMQRELSAYLRRVVGVDLSQMTGLVLYATRLGPQPVVGATVPLEGLQPGATLKGTAAGSYKGVPLLLLSKGQPPAVAALLPTGIAMGHPEAVRAAIDAARQQRPASLPRSLSPLAELDGTDVDLLAAVHAPSVTQLAAAAQRFGVQLVGLAVHRDLELVLRVRGDPNRLQSASDMLLRLADAGLAKLEQRKNVALTGSDVGAALQALSSYHQARNILDELRPKLDRGGLTSRYKMPEVKANSAAMVAVGGVLAAVAIPAFIKYVRRAKTVEATEGLDRLRVALTAYHDARRGRMKRFRFPASTPWSPPTGCCGAGGKTKCLPSRSAFDHPTWRALHFGLQEPHYFQYRLTSAGRGGLARVTLEARADLDCDGTFSNYKLVGQVDRRGTLTFKGPMITNEIE